MGCGEGIGHLWRSRRCGHRNPHETLRHRDVHDRRPQLHTRGSATRRLRRSPASARICTPIASMTAMPMILIVEDAPTIRSLITATLKREPLIIDTAQDGLEALGQVARVRLGCRPRPHDAADEQCRLSDYLSHRHDRAAAHTRRSRSGLRSRFRATATLAAAPMTGAEGAH